ncbi:diguanylate cyclase domain-containing protein [Thalassobacillus hwangdonensis]|uniref:Diguanylate cyclase domain-containing protein n=1 Tax=Thalassobacillus hwangdonensis TaxID=546108 RepID=A0ABW3KZ75_9BACI
MIEGMIINLAMIVAFPFLFWQLMGRITGESPLSKRRSALHIQLLSGALTGALGVILMSFSINVTSEVIIDLRHIAILIPALFFGIPATLTAAAIIALARILLFGSWTAVSITAGVGMIAIGVACGLISLLPMKQISKSLMMNVTSIGILTFIFYLTLAVFENEASLFISTSIVHAALSFTAGMAACYFSNHMFYHSELLANLKESNSQLKLLLKGFNAAVLVESPEGKVSLMNDKFKDLIGIKEYPPGEQGQHLHRQAETMFTSKEDYMKTVRRTRAARTPVTNEVLYHEDGRVFERDYAPIYTENNFFSGHLWSYRDVTEQKEMERRLRESKLRYASLFKHNQSATFSLDSKGNLTDFNEAAEQMSGFSSEELLGAPLRRLIRPAQRLKTQQHFAKILQGKSTTFESEIINRRGDLIQLNVNAAPIILDGRVIGIVGVAHDITEEKKWQQMLEESENLYRSLSNIDGLTGIPNRRSYDETLEREWRQAYRNGKPISMIMLDIDHFKSYNDTYGHLEGDECLRIISSTLEGALHRPSDFIARYGGEEFSVILPQTDRDGAKTVANSLHSSVVELGLPHESSLCMPYVTISLGVATAIPKTEDGYEELAQAADQALYEAKRNGRNTVHIHEKSTIQ